MKRLFACLLLPLFLSACGSDSDSTDDSSFPRTLDLGDNYTATLDMTDVTNGVADITVNITAKDGQSLQGQTITLSPLMIMASGMEHGTPFENSNGTLDESGSFTSTAYFLMPSNMPSGDPMGDWSITVTFDSESEIIPITVDMMSSDVKTLKGSDTDQIMNMSGGSTDRTYYLYNRGRHINSAMNMFEIYVAARESMMDYQAIADGNVLNADSMYELTINNVLVEMCSTECDLETNWITAMAKDNHLGIYQGMDLGLAGDDTDMIMVRLTVNDEAKDNGATENAIETVTFSFSESDSSSTTHEHM
ncbi:MAG: hypothetical protein JXR16_08285 [Bermanella sp.]